MSFTDAIKSGFFRLFDFSSRASRSEYWLWSLFTFAVSTIAWLIDGFIGAPVFSWLFLAVVFVPSLAVSVRRLHDVDRTGVWILISFVPIVGVLILLVWYLQEGTAGDNNYGESPLPPVPALCGSCGHENALEATACANCGASPIPQHSQAMPKPAADSRRLLIPLVGLVAGIIFTVIFLEVSQRSLLDQYETSGYGLSEESKRAIEAKGRPLVILSPFSDRAQTVLDRKPVKRLIRERVGATFELALLGGIVAVLIAWALSTIVGYARQGSVVGSIVVASVAGIPVYWLGLLMIAFFTIKLDLLPHGQFVPMAESAPRYLQHMLMPIVALGVAVGIVLATDLKSSKNETSISVLGRSGTALYQHAGLFISAIIFVEMIFAFPGIGRLFWIAVSNGDGPLIGATAAVFTLAAILMKTVGNIVAATNTPVEIDSLADDYSAGLSSSLTKVAVIAGVMLLILFMAPLAASSDPGEVDLRSRMLGASGEHIFGTDSLGRDVFSRLLHAARNAALIGVPVALVAIVLGAGSTAVRRQMKRSGNAVYEYVTEGVLEGLLAMPWLVVGILVLWNQDSTWPLMAVIIVVIPRALRVGWSMDSGRDSRLMPSISSLLHTGSLFMAASLVITSALGFTRLIEYQDSAGFGYDMISSRSYMAETLTITFLTGLAISVISGVWLAIATVAARAGNRNGETKWPIVVS